LIGVAAGAAVSLITPLYQDVSDRHGFLFNLQGMHGKAELSIPK
jgi:hypothetical protein